MEKVQRWLKEEPWLADLLRWFAVRLDKPRSRDITRRITPENVPALYDFGADADYRWSLIKCLSEEFRVLDIEPQRVKSGDPVYHLAQLRLRPEAEPELRGWLNIPKDDPTLIAWRSAVEQHFGANHALCGSPIFVAGRSTEEVVSALKDLAEQSIASLTLRELSARHFWGDSKFMDSREEWLLRVLGKDPSEIVPRPLLLATYAPKEFSRLLFIENQDTFVNAALLQPQSTALIYSGGFRATASRLGNAACFSFLPGSAPDDFRSRWQDTGLEAAFWGDLDFSGMAILASLRQSLPHLEAWQPAYSLMLDHLLAGGGHSPLQAGKELQRDPGVTGCNYADSELLPALRRLGRFVDQELLAADQLFS